jgi:hypothetical protein
MGGKVFMRPSMSCLGSQLGKQKESSFVVLRLLFGSILGKSMLWG